MSQIDITCDEYTRFRHYLETHCGIVLGDNKKYLVQSRMGRVLRNESIESFSSFLHKLQTSTATILRQKTIDAMTTNETLWFRDTHPFEYFKNDVLPEQLKSKTRLRIWCAACSSGQEPYSLSILIEELIAKGKLPASTRIEIIATDISAEVLASAKSGLYSKLALGRGLSQERMQAYFTQQGNEWCLAQKIRDRVKFTQMNLKDPFSGLGKFDIVFCRNVLIYFSAEFKADILRKIHGQLNRSGLLFLGASESLVGLKSQYEMVQYRPGIVYRAL